MLPLATRRSSVRNRYAVTVTAQERSLTWIYSEPKRAQRFSFPYATHREQQTNPSGIIMAEIIYVMQCRIEINGNIVELCRV